MNAADALRLMVRLACATALSVAATSCDVHEFPSEEPQPALPESRLVLRYDETDMPLYTTVELDSDGRRASRAGSAGFDSRHIIKVYADNGTESDGTRSLSRAEAATMVLTDDAEAATDERTVSMTLPPGRYLYMVWTDYTLHGGDNDHHYDTSDFSEITLRPTERDGLLFHEGNTPWRDAFRGEGHFRVDADGNMHAPDSDDDSAPLAEAVIHMHRPLARFVIVTTDLSDFISRHGLRPMDTDGVQAEGSPRPLPPIDLSDYRIVVRYTGYMPAVFNSFIDKPVNSHLGAAFESTISGANAEPGTAELGSDYVFVNGRESSVQVALDVYVRSSGVHLAATGTVTIPLVRNRLTVVRGRFLTSQAGSNVGINPGFFDDINIEIR